MTKANKLTMEQLLSKAAKIYKNEDSYEQKEIKNGEKFNLLDLFLKDKDEVGHSKFLAMLLDPNGSHGCGDLFLKKFIELCGIEKIKEQDFTNVRVITEYDIGSIDKKKENGGRIDIFININSKYGIIIENKIDAKDQEKQIIRYRNFAQSTFKNNFKIIYLSKYKGSVPALYSSGLYEVSDEDRWLKCISYEKEIIAWLDNCLKEKEVTSKKILCPTLESYKKKINNITGYAREIHKDLANIIVNNPAHIFDLSEALYNMKNKNRAGNKEIINLLKTDNNFDYAERLVEQADIARIQIINTKLKTEIEEIAKKYKLFISYFEISQNLYSSIQLKHSEDWDFSITFLFQKKNYTDLKYGILIDDGRSISKRRRNQLNKLHTKGSRKYNTWWTWWNYFEPRNWNEKENNVIKSINNDDDTWKEIKKSIEEKIIKLIKIVKEKELWD